MGERQARRAEEKIPSSKTPGEGNSCGLSTDEGAWYNYSPKLVLAGCVSNNKMPYISRTALSFGGLMCKMEIIWHIAE